MVKVFFKTLMLCFLWVILFANLIFAFNLTSIMPFGYTGIGDYSTKYFGVSTLIDVFTGLNADDFSFSNGILNYIRTLQNNLASVLNIHWVDVFTVQINNIADFFNAFGLFFSNLFKSIGYILSYIAILPVILAYLFTVVLDLTLFILKLLSGYYFTDLPAQVIHF